MEERAELAVALTVLSSCKVFSAVEYGVHLFCSVLHNDQCVFKFQGVVTVYIYITAYNALWGVCVCVSMTVAIH